MLTLQSDTAAATNYQVLLTLGRYFGSARHVVLQAPR